MIYAAADDRDMVQSVFTALRDLMSFPSGVFMPVSPGTLELQPGFCFECNAAEMEAYLNHYASLDPFVLRRPGVALLNQAVRFSDVISSRELGRCEFSEFMQRVPYHHALGILTGVGEQPVAVVGVHRQRHERDFCVDDQSILDRIGPHLARASLLRRDVTDPLWTARTAMVVFSATGEAVFLNAAARCFLGVTPSQALLAAVPAQGAGVINLASQRFRLTRLPWTAASLLHGVAMDEGAGSRIDCSQKHQGEALEERWSAATRQRAGAVILAFQPYRGRIDLTRRLATYGLSPRQLEIAAWAMRGLSNVEIARRVFIGEQTAREHFQEIYRRIGVRSRAELLAKVLGTKDDAIPAERCGNTGGEQI